MWHEINIWLEPVTSEELVDIQIDPDTDRKKKSKLNLASIIADYEIQIFCVCSVDLVFHTA